MTFKNLFSEYQDTLDWIERMKSLKDVLHKQDVEYDWKMSKLVAFQMFQHLRHYIDDGEPKIEDCLTTDGVENYPPKIYDNGYECPVIALLHYRGETYPVYNDDYGQQDFIVIDDKDIPIQGLGGVYDWYNEIDYIIDDIACEK